jgi:hypothetical protein
MGHGPGVMPSLASPLLPWWLVTLVLPTLNHGGGTLLPLVAFSSVSSLEEVGK